MNKSRFDFSREESKGLIYSFIILSISFSIFFYTNVHDLPFEVLAILAGVGLGFIFHQFAYKIVAMHFNYWAEFKIFWPGLLLALLISFTGGIFSVPGVVVIYGTNVSNKQGGLICLAGILSNVALSLIFLVLGIIIKQLFIINIITDIHFLEGLLLFCNLGFVTNASMAFFSVVPMGDLDGASVYKWSKIVFLLLVALIILVIWQGRLFFAIGI